jgi:hypothetical protein
VTEGKVKDKLQRLPKDIDETYERMLDSLDEFDKPRAKRALIWLVFSARQLYVEELVDACAIDVGKEPIIDDKLTPWDLESLLQDLVLIQPPLSLEEGTVEFQKHTVMLVHASIREFLVKERTTANPPPQQQPFFALSKRESNISVAQSCFAYLLCYNTYALRHNEQQFPLRGYAWYHWEDHIDLQAEHCVPTIPTATLRRKARRLYDYMKHFLTEHGDESDRHWTIKDIDGEDPTVLRIVLEGLKDLITSQHLEFQSLKTALNVPFFHPEYDEFSPMTDTSAAWGYNRVDNFSDGMILQRNLQRSASYKYRAMPDPSTWIRLLEILPAVDPDTMIRCRLFETKLANAPPYAALSYSWGDNLERSVITIGGHAFYVIKNQLILLRGMRSRIEDANPAIWLDALCIDQTDPVERSAQVTIMGTVFAQAREIVVGLSDGDDSHDKGVHLLADLANSISPLTRPNPTTQDTESAKHMILEIDRSGNWHHILEIFRNPWWSRRWMIQEIVLGIKAVILFGSMSFNFNIIEQVMLVQEFITDVLRESKSLTLATIEETPGWTSAKAIMVTRLEYRQNRQFALPMLLWRFKNSVSTDPRDRVYALLGLCEPQKTRTLAIDYTLSGEVVTLQTSRWILETYKTLDLLSIRSAFEVGDLSKGSSWTLPFHGQILARQPLNLGVFAGVDSFKIYSAAGTNTQPIFAQRQDGFALSIRGKTVDTIAKVLGPAHFDMSQTAQLIDLCDEIGKEQSSKLGSEFNQKTIEAKWRTLLANQWPLGTKLDTAKCQEVKVPPQTADEEKALLDVVDVQYHLPRLEGRRVIITAGGRLGLALEEVVAGDSIVILPGGALPFVLRSRSDDEWIFMGAWYV